MRSILLLTFVAILVAHSEQKCTADFEQAFLAKHNELRQKHGVPALVLNSTISAVSQEWADYLATNNKFEHRQPNKYGENLYMQSSSGPSAQPAGGVAVQAWYNEISMYHYFGAEPDMTHFSDWGHFTQLVWKGSQRLGVGCGVKENSFFLVGNYDPPGNVITQFKTNVPAPK